MDYDAEWDDEIAALTSIFEPDDLTVSKDEVTLRVVPADNTQVQLLLTIKRTPKYPEEIPELSIDQQEGDLDETDLEELHQQLQAEAGINLGMAMIFTLSSSLSDLLTNLLAAKVSKAEKLANEAALKAEEAEAARTRGTPVTAESFAQWKTKFLKEMQRKKTKEAEEALAALTPKEREERRRIETRLTGKELFEKNADLSSSDAAAVTEDVHEVDFSKYQRDHDRQDSEDEAENGIANLDVDSD